MKLKKICSLSSITCLFLFALSFGLLHTCLLITPTLAQAIEPERPPAKKSIPKLDSALSELLDRFERGGVGEAESFSHERFIGVKAGKVRVVAEMTSEASAKGLRLPGAMVESVHGRTAQVSVPLGLIKALTAVPDVKLVRMPFEAFHYAEVISEGVAETKASAWHDSGFSGQGVKVGIIDCTGFGGYEALLGTELPTEVHTASFHSEGFTAPGYHGTGCAEIVHDMAPDAELYLVNYEGAGKFLDAVDWLIGEGV